MAVAPYNWESPGQYVPGTPSLSFVRTCRANTESPAAVVPVCSPSIQDHAHSTSPHWQAHQPGTSRQARTRQRLAQFLTPVSPKTPKVQGNGQPQEQEQVVPCISPVGASPAPQVSPAKPTSAVYRGVSSPGLPECVPGSSCRPTTRGQLQQARLVINPRGGSANQPPQQSPRLDLFLDEDIFA